MKEFNEEMCAKYFNQKLREDVKQRMRNAIARGRTIGCAPTGYQNDTKNKIVVRDPMTFPILQKALRTFLSGKHNVREIVYMVNAEGFRTKSGKIMNVVNMKKIMRNAYYAGYIVDRFAEGKPLRDGVHEPMVSKDEFERMQKALDVLEGKM